ncbi:MAG: P-loop NTPase fold protein [Hormoscilla sp.]
MARYLCEQQLGGHPAPWQLGGVWEIGAPEEQNVVALQVKSPDEGQTLEGLITYAGEGRIGFRAQRVEGNQYAVENHEGELWVLGDWSQRILELDLQSSDEGQLVGSVVISGQEGTIGFRVLLGEEQIFATLESKVNATAIAPDGRSVVVGCGDGNLYRYDLLTGKALGEPFRGHDRTVLSVGFSPSGEEIVSGGFDGTVRLWSLDGKALGEPFRRQYGRIESVGFSPSGETIVSGGENGTVRLWSLDGKALGEPFLGHNGRVWSVGFSPSGETIVSGGFDGTVRLWSREGKALGEPFRGHYGSVYSVEFSPSGDFIVSGGADGTVRLWSRKGKALGEAFRRHDYSVESVGFSPSGDFIVSGGDDGTVRLWSLEGRAIGAFLGHSGRVSVGFSPRGDAIVSGDKEGAVRLWSLDGKALGEPFGGYESSVYSVGFSPSGDFIVSGGKEAAVRLWSREGKALGAAFRAYDGSVYSVGFSPSGDTIVSGSEHGTVRLWSREVKALGEPFFGHNGSFWSVGFSPSGDTIVSGGADGTVRLWSREGNPLGEPFRGHDGSVESVGFSPSGDTIVSGSEDGTVRLWSREGNPLGEPFRGHDGSVWSVGFSPSGDAIVSGGEDGTVRLWSREGNPLGEPFRGHEGSVESVGFSPSGDTIVSGGSDGTVRLWNKDGKALGEPFRGHEGRVGSVGFSPSGDAIVSGGVDGMWKWINPLFRGEWWVGGRVYSPVVKSVAFLARQNQRQIPQGVRGDRAFGNDSLGVQDELEALAEVLMLRSVSPPLAIGLLGSWGSGKSFGMHLIQQKISAIRAEEINDDLQAWGDPQKPEVASPYVGHIYSITFNAWTYAKDDLWASLMQEIFYELNRQIGLERRLVELFAETKTPSTPEKRAIERFIYQPRAWLGQWFQAQIWRPIRLFALRVGRVVDLAIVQPIWHVLSFLPFLIISFLFNIAFFLVQDVLENQLTGQSGDSSESRSSVTKKLGQASRSLADYLDTQSQALDDYLELQFQYYWRDKIPPGTNKLNLNRLETVIERVLYLLLLGFPKRLKDTQAQWSEKITNVLNADRPQQQSNPTSPTTTTEPHTTEEETNIFREGNDFWSILYELDPAKRTKKIREELYRRGKPFRDFNDKPGDRDLWQTLDELRHSEQQELQTLKQQRDEAEIKLQTLLKTEGDRRKRMALFKPIVKELATAAKLPQKDIDKLSAAGNIGKLLRQAIGNAVKTPLGFLAIVLFVAATVGAEQTGEIVNLLTGAIVNLATEIADILGLDLAIRYIRELGLVSIAIAIFPKLISYINAVKEERSAIELDPERDIGEEGKELNAKLTTLQLQVKEQEERAGFTANHSSLVDFVNARLNADTYGKHLGLMQQVRRDLEDLSQRLTPNETNRDRLKDIFPRGPARVVLYIDDLDRCPPDRVVEVLEAVQLLVKTPLFIVVLAIDDRYIARALEQVYQGVLKRKGKPSGIDYLEKIIQIPYRMRPIAPHAVKHYLESQTKVREESEKPDDPAQGTDPPTNDKSQTEAKTKEESEKRDAKSDPDYPVEGSTNDTSQTEESTGKNLPAEAKEESEKRDAKSDPDLLNGDQGTNPPKDVPESSASPEPAIEQQTTTDSEPERVWSKPPSQSPDPPKPPLKRGASGSPPFGKGGFGGDRAATTFDQTQPELQTVSSQGTQPTPAREDTQLPITNPLETVTQTVELDREEFDILVDCCKHVDITPRTAKRLLNIYKIMQIIWDTRKAKNSNYRTLEAQDKRTVMSFLALSGRYPEFMRHLLEEIDVLLEEHVGQYVDRKDKYNPRLSIPLNVLLHDKLSYAKNSRDPYAEREWKRFEGDIKRMVSSYILHIDRQTFELMISFCFVGDIGYDPDDRDIENDTPPSPRAHLSFEGALRG